LKKLSGSLRVVLVRPRNPLNIGAAARAMANFGFSDMAVVKPHAPVWRETVSAVGAEKLVLAARKCDSLDEAVGDCRVVLGTSTARSRRLERPLLRLSEVPRWLKKKPGQAALLFGSEKTGLSNKYLDRCHAFVTIPTSPECPSMNLGQAVAVCCYELAAKGKSNAVPLALAHLPASTKQVERLVLHVLEVFDAVGYLPFLPREERMRKIRRVLSGWDMKATDLSLIHGLLRHVQKKSAAARV